MDKSPAFSLSEALITLTIIGIIAAVSIPSLITNINEDHYKVAAKKAYADISGVIQEMTRDNSSLTKYIDTPVTFNQDFIKYFNVLKDCGMADCIPTSNSSDKYKTLTGEGASTWVGGEGQFVTADGMFFNIDNYLSSFGIIITVDVNGYLKPPNVYGKDTFLFQVINDKLLPMGAPGTQFPVTTYCNRSIPTPQQGFGCAINIMTGTDY